MGTLKQLVRRPRASLELVHQKSVVAKQLSIDLYKVARLGNSPQATSTIIDRAAQALVTTAIARAVVRTTKDCLTWREDTDTSAASNHDGNYPT